MPHRRAARDAHDRVGGIKAMLRQTAAALEILMAEDGVQKVMDAAVAAAENRGRELAG